MRLSAHVTRPLALGAAAALVLGTALLGTAVTAAARPPAAVPTWSWGGPVGAPQGPRSEAFDCPASGRYTGAQVRGGRMHEAAVVTPVRSGAQVGKSCEKLLDRR